MSDGQRMASKNYPVRVADGGRLVTSLSAENVGEMNWSRKLNMRRVAADQEGRQEGWILFVGTTQCVFDGTESVLRLAELMRPNGTRVIIGASRTYIKRYDSATGVWTTIGTGYSSSGKRWQVVTMNGYLVLNNTIDLPVVFRQEWRTVLPIYELREVGVASVGRIIQYNGFLIVADITEIKSDQLNVWMNGSDPYGIPPASITNRIPYALANGEFGEPRKWAPAFDVLMNAASASITLPFPSSVFKPPTSTFTPGGPASKYRNGAFDGTNIWFAPYDSTNVVKIDPVTGAVTNYAHTYGAAAFSGAVFDGTSIWLIPYNATSIVKVNISTGAFTNFANPSIAAGAFENGVFDGTNIWLVPYNETNLFRLNTSNGTTTDFGAHGKGAVAFRSGTFDGTNVWLSPYGSADIVKVTVSSGAMTSYAHGMGGTAFQGAAFDGQSVWLAPFSAASVLKIKISDGSFTAYTKPAAGTYSQAIFDGVSIWLMPRSSSYPKLTRVTVADGSMVEIPVTVSSAQGLWGAVFDGNAIWTVPYGDTVTQRFVPTPVDPLNVGVINGGPDGGVLGGQTNYPNGVPVITVNGAVITLAETTDVTLTYPRTVTVTRWADVSTIVARYLLQDDGSEIIGLLPLGDLLVIYRTTGIYIGRYTGDATNPFVFTPRYPTSDQSLNVPIWGDAIANVNGDYHLYPGVGNRFYQFDGVSWPSIHQVCDFAKELFFTGVVETDAVFSVGNPYTKQIWFCRPTLTFCYDFEFNSVSEMDAVIAAGSMVRKPGSSDRWFILAIGRFVYTYGLVKSAATNILTWFRPQTWISESASEANIWNALAWSPSLDLFAAVSSSGTNRVMTSPNGITWTARSASEANGWSSIAWSPLLGLFAAVSTSGTNRVMTSPNGTAWTARAAAEANTWNGITWSPTLGLFVAVASSGTNRVMTSPDGINWTARAAASAAGWQAITWSEELGLFAAVGSLGEIMTSPNGTTWTSRGPSAYILTAIAWGPELGKFVAVGRGSVTSSDGITWTDGVAFSGTEAPNGIAWSPDRELFVAVGVTGTIKTSLDGITWTNQLSPEANTWTAIAWSPDSEIFAAVGLTGTFRVMISDGVVSPTAILRSGLISARDFANEKILLSYTPVLSSQSADVALLVQLFSTHNPAAAVTEVMTDGQELPTPAGESWFTTAYVALFFLDMITLTDVRDLDLRISQRVLEFERVGSGGGIPRRVT